MGVKWFVHQEGIFILGHAASCRCSMGGEQWR